jgi:hypothetical protein
VYHLFPAARLISEELRATFLPMANAWRNLRNVELDRVFQPNNPFMHMQLK